MTGNQREPTLGKIIVSGAKAYISYTASLHTLSRKICAFDDE